MEETGTIIVFIIIFVGMLYIKIRFSTFLQTSEHPEAGQGTHIRLHGHEADIHTILENELYYYKTLSTENKRIFIRRVIKFNMSTVFYPQAGMKLGPRHVILISAAFVQITFGLEKSLLGYLNNIKIFPAHYFDPRTKRQYKGEVDVNGMICLSWEDFEIGLRDSNDGRNVGLHELAHAFAIEIIEKDANYHHLLMKLKPVFLRAKFEINNPYHRHGLLREYGYTNMHEYFAVSTELFFEKPDYLANSGSPLYSELCMVFNQDPYKQYLAYETQKMA
ncbi:MAG: zinc-dependent peptidase [Bacteroidales bacterium]|jgi:Mlc titration factor MtfA (ptsG expression regulator)|nr:zinc-dependent peptidase [Bacteroidales bacterium]HPB01866.1 zinc-dependent peptidase [Bacteroidales bacterium]